MRRWNGWGDSTVEVAVEPAALALLREAVGPAERPADAPLEALCGRIDREQPSRLPERGGLSTRAEDRLRASLGHSLGDWIRLRFGEPGRVVDGVVWPETPEAVRDWLAWARAAGAIAIPCGGATSVVGHLTPPERGGRPVLSLNVTRMRALRELDARSQLARFEAGVAGPDLEAQLRERGFTLGHFPQSFEYSTLGGWIATRSSGQQSLRYGRIEQLFAGGTLETPDGPLEIRPFPASAAGPDLREWVLGSEGRFGVITEAVVRVSRLPEAERWVGTFLPGWERAADAARTLVQARVPLSMLRLSSPAETRTMLAFAGHAREVAWLGRYLALRGLGPDRCLLLLAATGTRAQVAAARREAARLLRRHGAVSTGGLVAGSWARKRFSSVYLRNALWDAGYMVDTMETAVPWSATEAMMAAMERAGREALSALGERCLVYTHLSHVYPTGSSVYSTFLLRVGPDFASSWARWRALKERVSEAIVARGGTISHQHGVGRDHAPWMAREKGARGMAALGAAAAHFDPGGLLDSGNLTEGGT